MRIKQEQLEARIRAINTRRGLADAAVKGPDGKYTWTIGALTLDGAYGGWRVNQIVSAGGGVRTIGPAGYMTKSECYNVLLGIYDTLDRLCITV